MIAISIEQISRKKNLNQQVTVVTLICYLIPEDGILEITDKDGNKKTIEVKKHDVLFKMYSITDNFEDREYIVINNPELKDYYRRMTEKLEADKKAREAVSGEKVCCDCGSIGEK